MQPFSLLFCSKIFVTENKIDKRTCCLSSTVAIYLFHVEILKCGELVWLEIQALVGRKMLKMMSFTHSTVTSRLK